MVVPPATAQLVTTRLWSGLLVWVLLAVTAVWCGTTTAWYTDWPVSFCIAAISALGYFSGVSLTAPTTKSG